MGCRLALAAVLALIGLPVGAQGPRTVDGFPEVVESGTIRIDTHAVRLKGIAVPKAQTAEGLAARGWLHRRIQGRRTYCHFEPGQKRPVPIGTCEIEGLDLAALMVEAGVALDCPKESGGRYRPQQAAAEAAGKRLSAQFNLPDVCKSSGSPVKRGG